MHTVLRSQVLFGILAVFSSQGSAHPHAANGIAGQPLIIRVYSPPDVSPATLNEAMHHATRILATTGVDAIWQGGPTGAPESHIVDQNIPTSEQSLRFEARGYIVVVITRGVPPRCYPDALGYAMPHAQIGANVTIFYDRIERLTERGRVDPSTALGCAMAHEIGHVLLGSTEHTRKGIMKGVWKERDFRMAPLAAVGFTASERAAIQKRLSIKDAGDPQ